MSNFDRVADFLNNNRVVFVSSVGLDGKPRVRPFMFMQAENGKLYLGTSNQKAVYKELVKNPYTQICALSPQNEWIRVLGKVNFFHDVPLAKKLYDMHPEIHGLYTGGDDPKLSFFYLSECQVEMASFTKPAEKFNLP